MFKIRSISKLIYTPLQCFILGVLLPDGWTREVLEEHLEAAPGLHPHRHVTRVPQGGFFRKGKRRGQ